MYCPFYAIVRFSGRKSHRYRPVFVALALVVGQIILAPTELFGQTEDDVDPDPVHSGFIAGREKLRSGHVEISIEVSTQKDSKTSHTNASSALTFDIGSNAYRFKYSITGHDGLRGERIEIEDFSVTATADRKVITLDTRDGSDNFYYKLFDPRIIGVVDEPILLMQKHSLPDFVKRVERANKSDGIKARRHRWRGKDMVLCEYLFVPGNISAIEVVYDPSREYVPVYLQTFVKNHDEDPCDYKTISKTDLSWSQQDGVWLPTGLTFERTGATGTTSGGLKFNWSKINEQIAKGTFDYRALGKVGTSIRDKRRGNSLQKIMKPEDVIESKKGRGSEKESPKTDWRNY